MSLPTKTQPLSALIALGLVLSCLDSSGAAAQVIQGRVVDRGTGAPIWGVSVSLSDTVGSLLGAARTDSGGAYGLSGSGAGIYRLAFKRLGYREREITIRIRARKQVRVPETESALEALPAQLEGDTVVGERDRKLAMTGFYERRQEGLGSFITRAEFEIGMPTEVTHLFRRLRGIRIRPHANQSGRTIVEMARGGSMVSMKGRCPPQYFIDGKLVGTADDVDIDLAIRVSDIEAIEAYSGIGQIPTRFNIMGGLCGVIVIWTR